MKGLTSKLMMQIDNLYRQKQILERQGADPQQIQMKIDLEFARLLGLNPVPSEPSSKTNPTPPQATEDIVQSESMTNPTLEPRRIARNPGMSRMKSYSYNALLYHIIFKTKRNKQKQEIPLTIEQRKKRGIMIAKILKAADSIVERQPAVVTSNPVFLDAINYQ